MIAASEKLMWYVARSSGMVAWALVTASVLWGLALSGRLVRRRGAPAWLLDLHRYLATLSLVFTVVHMLGLVGDNWVEFGWSETFVPMASQWQPGNVAWGIAAFYLLVAIQATSWLMRRLPRRLWHTIHLSSIAMFVAASVHGWRAGTDRDNRVVQWIGLTGTVLVVTSAALRIGALRARRRARATGTGPRHPATTATAATAATTATAATAATTVTAADATDDREPARTR